VATRKPSRSRNPNRLRIIGGAWRGRKLAFPDGAGLRPTPDRVRETLFNWLTPILPGARCLDLFAGSGALGLEALSRGAAQVVLVDRDARVITQLREHIATLKAQGAELIQADALQLLQHPTHEKFDIIFLDPPYHQNLLEPCCRQLENGGWLAAGARVYLEAEAELGDLQLPPNWRLTHSKKAGQVGYHLAVVGD